MKKLIGIVLVLLLSIGALCACNNTNTSNGNTTNTNTSTDSGTTTNSTTNQNVATQPSSRTPAETVLLYGDLCTARDLQGLTDVLYGFTDMSWNFNDDDDETFVEMIIVIQNPNAQMEPEEIEYYQKEVPGLTGTAIVCAQETSRYTVHATGKPNDYVQYLDYYLITTKDHPDWMIVAVTTQATAN